MLIKRNFGFSAPADTPVWRPSVVAILIGCALSGSILAIVYRLVMP